MTAQAGLPTVDIAYAPAQIQRELEHWAHNLKKARATGDILATQTALAYLDTWLDRKLAQRGL